MEGDCNWNPLRRGPNFGENGKPCANRNLWFFRESGFQGKQKWRISAMGSISWVGNKIPKVDTSSFTGGTQAVFYGFDMARALKGILPELLFGNIGVGFPLSRETITPRKYTDRAQYAQ